MRTVVVYYSRTGVTRGLAGEIAERLGADIEELHDTKSRGGALGFVVACKDAAMRSDVPIEPIQTKLEDYDLVVVGTPVWANTMCSAVRAWCHQATGRVKDLAVFASTRTSGLDATLTDIEELLDMQAVAKAGFREKSVRAGDHTSELDAFVAGIREKLSTEG